MKVSIFGLGYVGNVTAACLAKDGHEIIGVDLLAAKVDRINEGLPAVVELRLDEFMREGRERGLISATRDAHEAIQNTDISIVCVGTPSRKDGNLDLDAVRATIETISCALRDKNTRHVVVLRSTVPAGTSTGLILPTLAESGAKFGYVVVPEFLREGSAIADYYEPPFVVIGSPEGTPTQDEPIVEALFGALTESLRWVRYGEAEMLKASCNAFHALKVAFANEIGALCHTLGIDGHALMRALIEDNKLNCSGAYLMPGLPFGGSCLPKDLRMILWMSRQQSFRMPLLAAILDSNELHLRRAIDSIESLGYKRVGLDGLAFKPNTDDLRESPLVRIAEYLIGKGYNLKIYDHAIETSLLTGANKAYIEKHIPHLCERLVRSEEELIQHAEVLVVTGANKGLPERIRHSESEPVTIDITRAVPSEPHWSSVERSMKELQPA